MEVNTITSVVGPLFISFFASLAIGPLVILFLTKIKMRQIVRGEGVQAHLKKAGTPTMGGIMIVISVLIGSWFYLDSYPRIIPVLMLTVGFGIIGFIDDYLKVARKNADGLEALQKMLMQIVVTAIFAIYMTASEEMSLGILIPFSDGRTIELGWIAYLIMFFAVIGTVNGTNFTDGLDGLAGSVTAVVAAFFVFASLVLGGAVHPVAGAMIGALLGFLMFNVYPAKIFMGDTGSLALGGFVIGIAYVLEMPIFVIIIGFVYVVEVLSVMIQVLYFKATGGRRVFKMTPIHHHFELDFEKLGYIPLLRFPKKGWSETRIVAVFTTITLLLCLVAFLGVW